MRAADIQPLMGRVFRTQTKERYMMIISKQDYKQRRHPNTRSNLLFATPKRQPQQEDTTVVFDCE